MKRLRFINVMIKKTLIFCTAFSAFLLAQSYIVSASETKPQMWSIQSVDTMKTSRDRARHELNNPGYDKQIEKEISAIEQMGANYVAIGTPYDEEFLPYLKRWVKISREHHLKIWFKGNFSGWEGWFDYPKNISPEQHLKKTSTFIERHPELFEDGDIFDPCPECENAGFWKQPIDNDAYNVFRRKQHDTAEISFQKINKNVYTNLFSIIGGRAYEVLDRKTADNLNNVITIDHYIKDPENMGTYINYFSKVLHSKTLVGEFGAPIPDINGPMTEDQQADFIDAIFQQLYKHRSNVMGVNYWVIYNSTTELLNEDYSPRKAVEVIKKYFKPGMVKGIVTDTKNKPLEGVMITASDGMGKAVTDKDGAYTLVVPSQAMTVTYSLKDHKTQSTTVEVRSGEAVERSAKMESIIIRSSIWEKIKIFFKRFL